VLNAQIDPLTDPNWYLNDPTLRRGDIVVLERRVLVYEGRTQNGPHARAEFADLRTSAFVPSDTRKLVIQMTGLMPFSELAEPPTAIAGVEADEKPLAEPDASMTSAVKPAADRTPARRRHSISVRTYAEMYPRRASSHPTRKRAAYAARQSYRPGGYPTRSHDARPAYAPLRFTPFWEW
jgi:hypothetical protein